MLAAPACGWKRRRQGISRTTCARCTRCIPCLSCPILAASDTPAQLDAFYTHEQAKRFLDAAASMKAVSPEASRPRLSRFAGPAVLAELCGRSGPPGRHPLWGQPPAVGTDRAKTRHGAPPRHGNGRARAFRASRGTRRDRRLRLPLQEGASGTSAWPSGSARATRTATPAKRAVHAGGRPRPGPPGPYSAGRVCMQMCIVDVTDGYPGVEPPGTRPIFPRGARALCPSGRKNWPNRGEPFPTRSFARLDATGASARKVQRIQRGAKARPSRGHT